MADRDSIPKIGTKIEMKITGYFGNKVDVVGTISKAPYHHGFNSKGGGWSLYDISDHGFECYPCYKFGFIPKRKRTTHIIDCEDVIEIKVI
jgi:hypothetical protein